MFQRIRMLVRLLTCLMILMAVAVQRNGSLFGYEISAPETTENAEASPLRSEGGAIIVNTSTIAGGIKGYGGPVPLEITIKDGKIVDIETLQNAESESFFGRVRTQLIPRWVGTSVADVAEKDVDAVTGATLSSRAVNATVKEGVAYALGNDAEVASLSAQGFGFTWKNVAVLLVVLSAVVVPLFVKSKYYRYGQLLLNVAVLGFWSGTFLSYELFVNYIANGANLWLSLAIFLMLAVAFVYPYFGKKTHYCAWVCPLGSLQELCGKSVKYKLKMPAKVVKGLNAFQECLWLALMFLMMAGLWFEWIDYELFKAFIFESAAIGVIIAAGVVVLLSFVVPRPYCRFICPTGYLFKITQNTDKEL